MFCARGCEARRPRPWRSISETIRPACSARSPSPVTKGSRRSSRSIASVTSKRRPWSVGSQTCFTGIRPEPAASAASSWRSSTPAGSLISLLSWRRPTRRAVEAVARISVPTSRRADRREVANASRTGSLVAADDGVSKSASVSPVA